MAKRKMKIRKFYNNTFIKIWRNLKPIRRNQMITVFFVMLLTSLSEIFTLSSVIPFLSSISNQQNLSENKIIVMIFNFFNINSEDNLIIYSSIIFILAILISSSFRLLNIWLNGRLAAVIGSDFSIKVYENTLYQPYINHLRRNSSEVISASTTKIAYTIRFISSTLQIGTALMISTGIFIGLLLIDFKTTIFLTSIIGISYLIIAKTTKKKLLRDGKLISHFTKLQTQALQEGLGAIREILMVGNQEVYKNIYKNIDLPLRLKENQSGFISAAPRFIIEAFVIIIIVVIALTSNFKNGQNNITYLGVFVLGAQRLLPALQQIYGGWAIIKTYSYAANDVLNLINQPLRKKTFFKKSESISFKKYIKLENISFKYSRDSEYIIKNLNLVINKGEKIGIIGETGAGKSTLIDLILCLLKPSEGKLIIDGIDIYENSNEQSLINSFQSLIAHVPQTIFLLDDSIKKNICLGMKSNSIDMNRIKNASEIAQIRFYIENLKNSYEDIVGERGVRLSGGQRQRIGIARAIYRNPEILILDEATSSLDQFTEDKIMKSIKEKQNDTTQIIISHRKQTLESCTKVYILKNGKLQLE